MKKTATQVDSGQQAKSDLNLPASPQAVLVQDSAISVQRDWIDPIDVARVADQFKLRHLNPHLPADGVDLLDVIPPDNSRGRYESWEEHRQRAESNARAEFGYESPNPYRSISQETRLLVGTLRLPKQLLAGTFKRLFGGLAETPSTWQVHAVAHALFDPPMLFCARESWGDVCRRAEFYAKRRERITAQVRELLALGE